ncbi:class II aldolase/adducin family protein [Cytobacillus oceanisediminis]|uniref:class II aldolase/adducin family protein n=1 Tax=Cytobacillus oceanisediminis TaxID=665099 RepID=UPI0011A8EF29|nr:class II aldolase/adducin family protein [Cytobacillus oceanisediminis]
MENYETNRQDLIKTGKFMMEYGLAWGNAGNISARVNEDTYLITASGTFLGELETEDLVECAVLGQSMVQEKKPSKETPMHQAIYQNRPEINAVLHASPFYSTLVACSNIDIPSNWFVETMYYLERVERVAYYHPGSQALGEAVAQKAPKANILLLENHGVLVYDTSLKEARMALQTLEMACKMLVTAHGAKIEMMGLPKEIEKSFLDNAGYKPRRTW